MRKIILSCLLLGISLTTYAQTSLFDLWQEASEHVNIYTYGLKKINKDTIYRPETCEKRSMFSSGLEAKKRYEIGNFFPHNRTLKKDA